MVSLRRMAAIRRVSAQDLAANIGRRVWLTAALLATASTDTLPTRFPGAPMSPAQRARSAAVGTQPVRPPGPTSFSVLSLSVNRMAECGQRVDDQSGAGPSHPSGRRHIDARRTGSLLREGRVDAIGTTWSWLSSVQERPRGQASTCTVVDRELAGPWSTLMFD